MRRWRHHREHHRQSHQTDLKESPPRVLAKIKIERAGNNSRYPENPSKKINTAAADDPISMPPDTNSIGVDSVIIDLCQDHDITHTIETS